MNDQTSEPGGAPPAPPARRPARTPFAALRYRGFQAQFTTYVLAMMRQHRARHRYWVVFQKFHSPALAGFAVLSHWLPF